MNFSCLDDLRPALSVLSKSDGVELVKTLREEYDTSVVEHDVSLENTIFQDWVCIFGLGLRCYQQIVVPSNVIFQFLRIR